MQDANKIDSNGRSALRRANPESVELNPVMQESGLVEVSPEEVSLSPVSDSDGWYARPSEYVPQSGNPVANAYYQESSKPLVANPLYVEDTGGPVGEGQGVIRQAGVLDGISELGEVAKEMLGGFSTEAMEVISEAVGLNEISEKLGEGPSAVKAVKRLSDPRSPEERYAVNSETVKFDIIDRIEADKAMKPIVQAEDERAEEGMLGTYLGTLPNEASVYATGRLAPTLGRLSAAFGLTDDPNLFIVPQYNEEGFDPAPRLIGEEGGIDKFGLSIKNRFDAYKKYSSLSEKRYSESTPILTMARELAMTGIDQLPALAISSLFGPEAGLWAMSGMVADNGYLTAIALDPNNPEKAVAYGLSMGLSDIAITKTFGKVFGEGFEGMFKNRKADPLVLRQFRESVSGALLDRLRITAKGVPRWALKEATPEAFEEAFAEVAQQLITAGFEIDPDADNWDSLMEAAIDGAVAAVFLTGTTKLIQGYKRTLDAMTPCRRLRTMLQSPRQRNTNLNQRRLRKHHKNL